MHNRDLAVKIVVATAALAIFTPSAFADIGWMVDVSGGQTDNATLVDTDPLSDTLSSVGGAIDYSLDGNRLDASLNGRGNYVHYADGTYDDDFQGYAAGSLVFGFVPDAFLWTINDNYGQIAIKQFEPVTPENRQNINTFSTGPDLILPLGSQSDLKFSARFGDTRYEDSDQINTQTWQGSLSFLRGLSQSSSWGLIASDMRIEYDVPGKPTYDQPELYATWQSTGARQSLSVDLGANRIKTDTESFTKPLVRLDWNRRIAPSWTADLNLGSEYQNTSQQFVRQNDWTDIDTARVGVTDVPAAVYHGGLSFAFQRPRTQFNLGGGYTQLEYITDNGLNEDSWYGNTGLSRRFTPRLQGFLDYRIEEHTYDSDSTRDNEKQVAGARLEWLVGKATFLAAGYRHTDSDSDSLIYTYKEDLYYLTVSYRRGDIATPRAFAY